MRGHQDSRGENRDLGHSSKSLACNAPVLKPLRLICKRCVIVKHNDMRDVSRVPWHRCPFLRPDDAICQEDLLLPCYVFHIIIIAFVPTLIVAM